MKEDTKTLFICPCCGKQHPKSVDVCPEKGEAIPAHYKLVGNILEGKYAIQSVIGEGGMGVVFEAKHMIIGRKLAVKVLFPEIATHPEIVERFYNEARTAASIGHDHIIEITDMGTYEKSPFIVMEYLEGQNLTKFMGGEALTADVAVGILMQVLDALNAVHGKGVIHRDLKPDNIFLIGKAGRADFVKLLDFGISKLKTTESQNMALTRTGTILGTPYYMAPEQAAGRKDQDHRIDLYAVGVILFEMLTGQLPFKGDNYNALIAAILTEEPPRPTYYNPGIPHELENIVMKAISKQPHLRYSNALNFMEALRPFAPSWVFRPSKTSALTSTAAYGRTVATPTPMPPLDLVAVKTPAPSGDVRTGELSMSDGTLPEVPRRRTGLIVGMIAVVTLLVVSGVLAIALGPRLLGKGSGNDQKAEVYSKIDIVQKNVPQVDIPPVDNGKQQAGTGPGKVKLELSGVPEEAVVTLDGKHLEENPAEVEPSPDPREIVIEAPGYEPWTARKVVKSDMVIDVVMARLETKKRGSKKKGSGEAEGEGKPPAIVVEKVQPEKKEPEKKKPTGKKGSGVYQGKVKITDTEYPE
jgi:serine/threonine protein kinase